MALSMKRISKKKPKMTPEERRAKATERAFIKRMRSIFGKAGFERIPAEGKEFEFLGRRGEFDDIFVKENVIVCSEYTLSKQANLGDHVKGKAYLFNLIHANPAKFIKFLLEQFKGIGDLLANKYHEDQLRVRIVYCSQDEVNQEHSQITPQTHFMWTGTIMYFKAITDTVKLSARYEFYEFLKLKFLEVGEAGLMPSDARETFKGTLLPEAHSHFNAGFKVVSFYVSPGALLKRAYVLRKDGWKDNYGLFQRMIDKKKVESIRRHLRTQKRAFVNNIIITLPNETRLETIEGKPVAVETISETLSVKVSIPQESNSIGIIDGQHRIFSYYEDLQDDQQITKFRNQQNLLATGIIYPELLSEADRRRFEAKLFLEINSTQNSPSSSVIQAVGTITDPYLHDSIGKGVIAKLSQLAPLKGLVERHFFDKNVLKTASVVSFGLRRLVRLDGDESLIRVWSDPRQGSVLDKSDVDALQDYVSFCASEISLFLSAAKANLPSESWSVASKDSAGILATVSLNGLIILFRKLVKEDGLSNFDGYRQKLKVLHDFNFKDYHSSHYNRMAQDIKALMAGQ